MTGFKRLVRGLGLGMAGSVSLVTGLLLAERLVRPDVIGQINTPVLIALVSLFVLPALTFVAIRHDGRVLSRLRDLRAPARADGIEPGAAGSEAQIEARVVRHGAHDRDAISPDHRHTGQPKQITAE